MAERPRNACGSRGGRPVEVVSAGRDGEAPRPTLFIETEEVRCTRPQAWLWC